MICHDCDLKKGSSLGRFLFCIFCVLHFFAQIHERKCKTRFFLHFSGKHLNCFFHFCDVIVNADQK